jgi:uncharacterized cupredoxin-like copper-binding protein
VRLARSAIAVLAAAVVLVACGGGGGDGGSPTMISPPPGGVLKVTATEFVFNPKQLTAQAGVETAIALRNVGTVEHNLTIEGTDVSITAGPGETATATFTLPAGTYTLFCSLPGHREAGMTGTLTVS